MKSSYMEFEFGRLHYRHSVTDKEKTIVLLHSFNSSVASYARMSDLLKDKFNIFAIDLPGHGLSSHVDINKHGKYYSFEGFTDVLIKFVNRLGLKNFFIIGDSVGGNMAVRTMSSLDGLQGIILECSVQANSAEQLFEVHHESSAIKLLFNKELSVEETEIFAEANVSSSNPEKFKQMVYDINNTDGNCRQLFGYFMGIQPWVDELQILKTATIPFMYILGEQDVFIDHAAYKALLLENGIHESQIKILDGVNHIPHLQKPELCADLISEFVSNRK